MKGFEAASEGAIPFEVVNRREGDLASYFADAGKAKNLLGWRSKLGIEDICRSTWEWQSRNPAGYDWDLLSKTVNEKVAVSPRLAE